MKNSLFLVCLIINILLFCASDVNGQCPYDKECINVKNCPSIVKLLEQNPIPPQDVERLKNSQCGYEYSLNLPKVCCPRPVTPIPELLPDEKECGKEFQENPSAIYRGQTTTINDFPWMVLLQYQTPNGTKFFCGGSLINHNYVITAAHCVTLKPINWKLVSVRLGEHQLGVDPDCEGTDEFVECADSPIDVPIEYINVHSKFNHSVDNQANNIALIRLNRSVSYSKSIQPICLPVSSELTKTLLPRTNMVVAGFGANDMHSQSNTKQKAEVSVTADSECEKLYEHFQSPRTDTNFCTRGTSRNLCITDVGGPLMKGLATKTGYRWYLYGIMSAAKTPCSYDGLEIYTNVSKYVSWIVDNLKP